MAHPCNNLCGCPSLPSIHTCGAGYPDIEPAKSPAEPMVRGLSAGGRWIRTIGPPVTCELCWRGLPLLPARERERLSAISPARRAIPSSLAAIRFGRVAVCDAARPLLLPGGTVHIYLRPSSARL